MKNSNGSTIVGVGLFDALIIVNVVLKLCGVINWPWIVCLWPLVVDLVILAIFILVCLYYVIKEKRKNKRL